MLVFPAFHFLSFTFFYVADLSINLTVVQSRKITIIPIAIIFIYRSSFGALLQLLLKLVNLIPHTHTKALKNKRKNRFINVHTVSFTPEHRYFKNVKLYVKFARMTEADKM